MWKRIGLTLVGVVAMTGAMAAQDAPELPDEIIFEVAGISPEGVEYDAERGYFLVGSLNQGGTIYKVMPDGSVEPFIENEAFQSTVGIHIDAANNRLLVPNSSAAAFINPNVPGYAALGAYDLETGEELFYVELVDVAPGARMFANDVTVDAEGNTYITNSFAPLIYKVTPEGEASVLVEDERLGAPFLGLNGIDYHPDGYLIAAVAGTGSIYKIPLEDPTALSAVEIESPLGIDGLILVDEGRSLIGVANLDDGQALVWVESEDDWATAVIRESVPTSDAATTVTWADGAAYYVNAYLNNPLRMSYELVRVVFEDLPVTETQE